MDSLAAKQIAVNALENAAIAFESNPDSIDAIELGGKLADAGGAPTMNVFLLGLARELAEKGFCSLAYGIDADRWYLRLMRDF